VIRQYHAGRFVSPAHAKSRGTTENAESTSTQMYGKRVGTISVGSIVYIQDGVSPLKGLTQPVVCREPWIVEAWIPGEYTSWDPVGRAFGTVRTVGGHIALVRSLRDRRRVQTVADWILLSCIDAGLETGVDEGRKRVCRTDGRGIMERRGSA
jgi:hypothetical protein